MDLHATLNKTVKFMQPTASEKSLRMSLHIAQGVPSAVVSDERRVRQMLVNLIANAAKFTKAVFTLVALAVPVVVVVVAVVEWLL